MAGLSAKAAVDVVVAAAAADADAAAAAAVAPASASSSTFADSLHLWFFLVWIVVGNGQSISFYHLRCCF